MKQKIFSLSRSLLAILAIFVAVLLAFQAATPTNAQRKVNLAGKWDRLNPDQSNPTPEHEVLRCGGNASPNCIYDKHPEPVLGFENPPDATFGHFRGEDVTVGWVCPDWFPLYICNNTTFVARGVMDLTRSDGSELIVDQVLIVTDRGGESVLYVYWVNQQFACPWFRSFDEALAANPFPTPFNGQDWPAGDCVVPP